MAEEKKVEAPEVDEVASNIESIIHTVNANPSLKEVPGIKEIYDKIGEIDIDENDFSKNGEKKAEIKKEPKEEPGEEQEEEEEEEEEEEPGEGKTSIFFAKKKKAPEIDIKKPEDVVGYVKNRYAIEIKDLVDKDGWGKFFSSADGWRKDSQQLVDISKKYDDMVSGLAELPQPLYDAIEAWGRAEDWSKVLNNTVSRLDYNVDFGELEEEDIIKHYFPEDIKELKEDLKSEDIDDDYYEKELGKLKKQARRFFDRDKKDFNSQRALLKQKEVDRQGKVKESAESSVEDLRKDFPDFSAAYLKKVRQRLVTGDLASLFYNKDGSYKKDAAKRIAFAEFGEEEQKGAVTKAERKGNLDATEEFIKKSPKKVATKKQDSEQGSLHEKEALEKLSTFGNIFTDDIYDSRV